MVLIESLIFTKLLPAYLGDESYNELQEFLLHHPDSGKLIEGTGGLRKLRWACRNKGKRGGLRIIYYWQVSEHQIYLLTVYAKNEISDLSSRDKKFLKQMVEGEFKK